MGKMSPSAPKPKVSNSTASKRTCIGRTLTLRRCRLAPDRDRLLCAKHRHQGFTFPIFLVVFAAALFVLYRGGEPVLVGDTAERTSAKMGDPQASSEAKVDNGKPSARQVAGDAVTVARRGQAIEPAEDSERIVVPGNVPLEGEGLTESAKDLAERFNNRGRSLHSQGELDDAVGEFDQAIEIYTRLVEKEGQAVLAGDLAAAHHNRGLTLQSQGKLNDAVRDYTRAVETYARLTERDGRSEWADNFAGLLNNRGLILYSRGEIDHAVQDYDKAIEIYTHLIEQERRTELREYLVNALGNRGLTLSEQGMRPEATADITMVVEILEQLVSEGRIELEEKLQGARQILGDWTNEEPGE